MNAQDKLDIVRALKFYASERCYSKDRELHYVELMDKVLDLSFEEKITKQVLFKETEPESLWSIFVDGELIEAALRNDEHDIADSSLDVLWKALGVKLKFENHPDG